MISLLLAFSPVTHAAEPGVHRIRIDDARTAGSLRTVVQTDALDSDPGSLTVTVTGLDDGSAIGLSAVPKSTRTLSTAAFGPVGPDWAGIASFTFTAADDPTLVETVALDATVCTADCPWQEASLADGSTVRVKLGATVDADGSAQLAADVRWAGPMGARTLSAASFASEDLDGDGVLDGMTGSVSAPVYRTRWVTPKWSTAAAAVELEATLTAADGSVDTLSDLAVLRLEGSGLSEATVQPRRKKEGYKATFITVSRPEAPVAGVDATVRDETTDTAVADLSVDAPVETVTVLDAPLGRGAGGEATLTIQIADADGTAVLAESFTVPLAEGDVEAAFTASPSLAVSEAALVAGEDGELHLRFALTGAAAGAYDAADVVLATPDAEAWLPAGLDFRLDRWTATFVPPGSLDTAEVTATVRGAGGDVLDGWTFGVSTDAGGIALRTASIGGVKNNGMDPQLKGGGF